jgi:hypothetical protein
VSRQILSVLTVLFVSAALSAPSRAELKSFKGPLVKDARTEVSVENSGVRVLTYQFNRPLRKMLKLFKESGPTMFLTVSNETAEPMKISLGVALFDQHGNLVGVSTEESGKLKPGEIKEVPLVFRHLNRYAKHATTMQMSLETQL